MSFRDDLIKARGHLVIISAVIVSLAVILKLENIGTKINENKSDQVQGFFTKTDIILPDVQELSNEEIKFAKVAWKYFENNYDSKTGLVNSVDKYNASTMWDTASYLLALISAQELGIIKKDKFNQMMNLALDSLSKISLLDGEVPNKSYNTNNLNMVDYRNKKTDRGIGWSAIDVGRLFIPFYINILNYPEHAQKSKDIIKRFKMDKMVKNGLLYGSYINSNNKTEYVQEGRLGYEEYAAKSFNLSGFNPSKAIFYDDFTSFIDVYSVKLPVDNRDPKKYKAHNYVVSEPYILDGIELGFDDTSKEFAYRVYKAQEEKFKNTGVLTAVSEDNIDQKPYFVYNTVFSDGVVWNCITDKGEDASKFKSISTKAVFGWDSLYRNDYTKKLMDKIENNFDPNKGWYSGIYESNGQINKSITCNTNAIILESLYYKKFGKLVKLRIR